MTRILTIIALLFATPAWAEAEQRSIPANQRCIIFSVEVSYELFSSSLKNCPVGVVAAIYGDESGF